MKRHERDVHGKNTISTSPPAKRKRNSKDIMNKSVENMDIEDKKESEEEKMEIDEEMSNCERMKRMLSDRMDKKVIEKQRRIDDNEKKWTEDKLNREKNKEDNNKQILENNKKTNKINKQKSKDRRKKISKKNKKENKTDIKIKDVPDNCRKFVNEGDKVFIVPGDGACAPNSAAAHLFQDVHLGPKLRLKMNYFLAEHYDYYEKIVPCSEDNPFVRKLKGKNIRFTDPNELRNFLKTSQEAGNMWSDSEDLKVLSDMYQINVKIITTKGLSDENPSVNWIYPDKKMGKFAELQNVQIDDLVLLHENDNHFDLVVSANSELVKYGNLSSRNNHNPISHGVEVQKKEEVIEDNSDSSKEISDLKNEIEKLKKKNEVFEKQYFECEKELRRKTEEAERLKSELKDIKLKIDLENKIKANDEVYESSFDIEDIVRIKNSGVRRNDPSLESSPTKNKEIFDDEEEFNCNDCDYQGNSQGLLQKHIRLTHTMEKYKCTDCNYQASDGKDLYNHRRLKHSKEEEIKCKQCEYVCNEEQELHQHIRLKHTVELDISSAMLVEKEEECKNTSSRSEDMNRHIQDIHKKRENYDCEKCEHTCSKVEVTRKHKTLQHLGEGSMKCKTCGEVFNSKPELMRHRKLEHPNTVANCRNYSEGRCNFDDNSCWWHHKDGEQVEIECYFCEKTFDTKGKVMIHRKMEHPRTVKQCIQFEDLKCKFNEETCWFKHEKKNSHDNLVFRQSRKNQKNT